MSTQSLRALGAVSLLLAALPAAAAWEEAYDTGSEAVCVVADPVHQAVYVGTGAGLVVLDVPSGQWSAVSGGPTDPIWDLAWHPTHPGRLVLARGNAAEGRIERSDDLGATVDTVLTLPVNVRCGDLERDPSNPDHLLATTWTWLADGGMVFGSEDGGAHWQQIGRAHV